MRDDSSISASSLRNINGRRDGNHRAYRRVLDDGERDGDDEHHAWTFSSLRSGKLPGVYQNVRLPGINSSYMY